MFVHAVPLTTQKPIEETKKQKVRDIEELLKEHIRRGEPKEPTDDDCCGNGCNPCVWDVYYERQGEWKDKKDELEELLLQYEEDER